MCLSPCVPSSPQLRTLVVLVHAKTGVPVFREQYRLFGSDKSAVARHGRALRPGRETYASGAGWAVAQTTTSEGEVWRGLSAVICLPFPACFRYHNL